MDVLTALVTALTKEETRHFKLYLQRIEKTNHRKDEILFDAIRQKGIIWDEEKVFKKLYDSTDKNTFYKLKNRLQEMVSENLTTLHVGKISTNKILHHLQLYAIFQERNLFELAFYFLKRAEKFALQLEDFELLDVIYNSFIKLSSNWIEFNPEIYIQKLTENEEKRKAIRQMDQVIAAMRFRLLKNQNYGDGDEGLMKVVQKTLQDFGNSAKLKDSKQFQTRLYKTISQQLLQQEDYEKLAIYIKNTLETFTKKSWFDKANAELKIVMIIYWTNSLVRLSDYKAALEKAQQLKSELKIATPLLQEKFTLYYLNSLVTIYYELDVAKALGSIKELEVALKKTPNPYFEQLMLLNKALVLYKLEKYNESIRSIIQYYLHDYYKRAEPAFKLRVAIAELIIQFDSGDFEVTKTRAEQVKKDFTNLLIEKNFLEEQQILKIINLLCSKPTIKENKRAFEQIQLFLENRKNKNTPDHEVLNYKRWIDKLLARQRVKILE